MKTAMREKQWARKYPELGTAPLPAEPYVSEEYFALERDRVFRRAWINVGRTDEVPGPGDYFVRDVAICKVSVLVIRGSDGVVRAFHNVCSHRSNKLVLDERGSCPGSLNCHFHNWVYSDKGKLVRVPDEENFFGLDKRDHGLTPIELDTWEGFIFVHLDPEPAETLREFLGGVADQLDGFPFHEMRAIQTYRVEERANWKVAFDAQNELYHFPFMHRRSVGNVFVLNDKGQCRYQDVNLHKHHCVWSCEHQRFHELTPLKVVLYSSGMKSRELRTPQMIGETDFVALFPNFVILLYRVGPSASYATYRFWPLAVDRTIWEIGLFTPPEGSVRERLQQEYFKSIQRDTLQEDTLAHETMHAGLATRARSHVILQDNEIPIRHFHKVLEEHVGFYRDA